MLSEVERNRVRAPLAEAWTLPPRAYTDAAVWGREVDAIFGRDWVCVARVDQVAEPGAQLAIDVGHQPIVVTNDDGTIRALSNVCLHRAMPLVDGQASGRFLTCPYHLWSYSLDGRLRTTPLMEGCDDFDPDALCLPELALEIWEGFVFVSLAPEPAPLAPQLEPLRSSIERYDLGRLVVACTVDFDSPWNWKLLVENFMEAYHHIGPHRETFQPIYPAAKSSVDDNGGGPWSLLRMPGARGDGDGPGRNGVPWFPRLHPEERDQLLAACVFPSLLFALSGNMGAWYQLQPRGHDDMALRIHVLLEPEVLARPGMADQLPAFIDDISTVHGEDIAVNAGPWRGLQAPMTGQGRLSPLEGAIWQLNQYWLDRMESTV